MIEGVFVSVSILLLGVLHGRKSTRWRVSRGSVLTKESCLFGLLLVIFNLTLDAVRNSGIGVSENIDEDVIFLLIQL